MGIRGPSRRVRVTPSFVISCIALFVALSGTAVALKGKNTVASDDIKPNAVKSSDLAPKAVNAAALAQGAVGGGQIGPDAITSGNIEDGTVLGRDLGPVNVVREGVPGFSTTPYAIAKCPPGRRLLSGGGRTSDGSQVMFRNQPYYPDDDELSGKKPIGWIAQSTSDSYFKGVVAYAICLQ